jgi:hypothetical protein
MEVSIQLHTMAALPQRKSLYSQMDILRIEKSLAPAEN